MSPSRFSKFVFIMSYDNHLTQVLGTALARSSYLPLSLEKTGGASSQGLSCGPDLIVFDCDFATERDIEYLQELRAQSSYSPVATLLLMSADEIDPRLAAYSDAVLKKPFSLDAFFSAIRSASAVSDIAARLAS